MKGKIKKQREMMKSSKEHFQSCIIRVSDMSSDTVTMARRLVASLPGDNPTLRYKAEHNGTIRIEWENPVTGQYLSTAVDRHGFLSSPMRVKKSKAFHAPASVAVCLKL